MPKTMPASGVLNAAATPAAPPARSSPGRRSGERRPDRRHDGRADLHGRPLAAGRGAAEEAQRHHARSCRRRRGARSGRGEARILGMAGRDHLRDAGALRVREDGERQEGREPEAEGRHHERDQGETDEDALNPAAPRPRPWPSAPPRGRHRCHRGGRAGAGARSRRHRPRRRAARHRAGVTEALRHVPTRSGILGCEGE